MLREAEVRLSQGEKIGKICRGLGISEQSYYRWRRLYGGLKVDQANEATLTSASTGGDAVWTLRLSSDPPDAG